MQYYKENFEEVIERNRKLASPDYCGAVIHVGGIREMQDRVKAFLPGRPINQWNYDRELYQCLDISLANSMRFWENRTDVHDDMIPTITPGFGIAEHSAFMGGEVDYQASTSYQIPFLKDLEHLDDLCFHPDSKLLNYLLRGMAYLKEKGEGRVALRLRGCEDGGDVANAIRGNDLFTDFYDSPEQVRVLFRKCMEGSAQYMKCQRDIAGDFFGGTLSGMSAFMPANSFGHLSVDWTYMCSADFFRDFAKDLLVEQIAPYQAALMHVHSGGTHVIPELASIENLSFFQLSHDPNQPTAMETFRKYEKYLKNKFVVLETNPEELKQNLEFLQDKRVLLQMNTNTFAEARALVDFVKQNLPIVRKA